MTDPKTVTVQERLLEKLERKIASTGAWMTSDLRGFYTELRDCIRGLQSERASMEGEIERLREALKPFAKAADIRLCGEWRDEQHFSQTDVGFHLTFGDLRQARAALTSSKTGDEG